MFHVFRSRNFSPRFVSIFNNYIFIIIEKLEAQWLFTPAAASLAYYTDKLPDIAQTVFLAVKQAIRNWAASSKEPEP